MNAHQNKIYKYLLDRIMDGELAVRERIPTEKQLSEMFGTTRMNAHRAIKRLEEFGVLQRNKKRGTVVRCFPTTKVAGEMKSINSRRICVLNHMNPELREIHWNKRINDSLSKVIRKRNIDMVYKDISGINNYEQFSKYIKKIVEEGYNALIMVGDDITNQIIYNHPEVLYEFHNNVFIFGRGSSSLYGWPYSVVSVNLFREGVMAAEHVISQGYEKIIYALYSDKYYWVKERLRGMDFCLKNSAQISHDTGVVLLQREKDVHQNKERLSKVITGQERCAVIALNDEVAVNCCEAAKLLNLTPGVDFGLVGFDNNAKYKEYNLTTISPPLEQIGSELGKLVVKTLDGKNNGVIANLRIDSKLIVRDTC